MKVANKINFVGLLVLLVFSSINLARSCYQDSRIKKIDYQVTSINHRPLVKFADRPDLINYKMDSTLLKVALKDIVLQNKLTYKLKTKEYVTFRLKLVNVGNSVGKVLGIVTLDTTSADEILRKRVLKGNIKLVSLKPFPAYSQSEVLPSGTDTIKYDIEQSINIIEEEGKVQFFTLHYLVLYENELGHLYDTYFWARFKLHPLKLPFHRITRDEKLYVTFEKSFKTALKDMITFDQDKTSFNSYDHNEAETVRKYLNEDIANLAGSDIE